MKANQNELARLRAKRGLTLQDVASGAGVATSTILQIERGRDVRLSTMLAVSKFYGVRPAALWPILK